MRKKWKYNPTTLGNIAKELRLAGWAISGGIIATAWPDRDAVGVIAGIVLWLAFQVSAIAIELLDAKDDEDE